MQIVELLLGNKANPRATDADGVSAIQLASKWKHKEATELDELAVMATAYAAANEKAEQARVMKKAAKKAEKEGAKKQANSRKANANPTQRRKGKRGQGRRAAARACFFVACCFSLSYALRVVVDALLPLTPQ